MIKERLSEEEYAELLEEFMVLAIEMKVPFSVERWDLEVKTPNGKIEDQHSCYSQSWLRNLHNQISGIFCGVNLSSASPDWGQAYINHRDQSGTITTGYPGYNEVNAALGADTEGILVGTGAAVEAVNDYSMSSKVSHGKTSGELYHYRVETDQVYSNWVWNSGPRTFTRDIVRYFANWSGGSIVVTNVGIAQRAADRLLVRDKLGASVTVNDARTLRAKYSITSTVYP